MKYNRVNKFYNSKKSKFVLNFLNQTNITTVVSLKVF